MRTLIGIFAAGILATIVGCGSSSDSTTPSPRNDAATPIPPPAEDASVPPSGTGLDTGVPTPPPALDASVASDTPTTGRTGSTGGQCPASSSGQTCTGETEYNNCALAACSAEYKAAFGNNYASGDFTGSPCAAFMACQMQCPCDSTGTTCEATCAMQTLAAGSPCMTALTALSTCVQANTAPAGKCVKPVCSGGTSTATSTLTSTSTATGTSCAAAQACCATLSVGAQQCAAALVGQSEATCATVLSGLTAQGLCPNTTATATSTATLTATSTATSTVTSTTTPTSTSTTTATATGTGCAAAQACCAALGAAYGAALGQQCSTALAGQTDAVCTQLVATYKQAGICP